MIFITSDTHFNHKNIIQYENRPFGSIPEMNDALIKNWNSVVKPTDLVIHLGDVGLGNVSDLKWIVPKLNGHKILIKGNHDGKSEQFYLDCGFLEVLRDKTLVIDNKMIYCSHEPEKRPLVPLDYNLHLYGHVHSKGHRGEYPTIARNGACVCVERWNYTPVPLETIIKLCGESGIHCDNI